MRTLGTVLGVLAGVVVASAGVHPRELPLSAQRALVIGNSTRVVVRGPGGLVPAPVGCNGSVMIDERVFVGDIHARTALRARLLSDIMGDVVVTDGVAQLANQVHIRGSLTADQAVIVGTASQVDGDLTSVRGTVKVGRLAIIGGDVYAGGEFRGDRDVQVGAPGTVLAMAGGGLLRDRGEYFGDVMYEGALKFIGLRRPKIHGDVTAMANGALVEPAMDSWGLDMVPTRRIVAGRENRRIAKVTGGTVLAPGAYGAVTLDQESTIVLGAGEYSFESLLTSSDTGMVVDLGGGAGTTIVLVRGDVNLGRRFVMTVRGGGEGDPAARILFRAGGTFRADQDSILHGTMLADRAVELGKHTRLTGAAWSRGVVEVGRDSDVVWVPSILLD
ncbi:MAG TPA: hypothetical protein VGR62_21440 [Candidatus Binatia bacterium]|nr:hypothetical protein [Candidatus Binatia bacterium]